MIRSVKGNKALLLTKVTKEGLVPDTSRTTNVREGSYTEEINAKHLEHRQKKEGEIIGSKNDFFPQRERASDT